MQQTVFISFQTYALKEAIVSSCSQYVQAVLPTIFVLGYIQLVFGAETTFRAFRSDKFAARKALMVTIYLGICGTLMLFTWLPTAISKAPNRCAGNMILLPLEHSDLTLSLSSILILSFLTMSAFLGKQLVQIVKIGPGERIAASRMFYYLLASIVDYALILPFFMAIVIGNFQSIMVASRVAAFGLSGSGILFSVIFFLLRTNALQMTIKPIQTEWPAKRRFRIFGPSDLNEVDFDACLNLFAQQEPVYDHTDEAEWKCAGLRSPYKEFDRQNCLSISPPMGIELDPAARTQSMGFKILQPHTATPQAASHKRNKACYSLFPSAEKNSCTTPAPPSQSGLRLEQQLLTALPQITKVNGGYPSAAVQDLETSLTGGSKKATEPQLLLQPTTYSSIDAKQRDSVDTHLLRPPAPSFAAHSHRRGSSGSSCGTLQIGLRMSSLPFAIPKPEAAPTVLRGLKPTLSMRAEDEMTTDIRPTSGGAQSVVDPTQAAVYASQAAHNQNSKDTIYHGLQQQQIQQQQRKESKTAELGKSSSVVADTQAKPSTGSHSAASRITSFQISPTESSLVPSPLFGTDRLTNRSTASPATPWTSRRSLIGVAITASHPVGDNPLHSGFF